MRKWQQQQQKNIVAPRTRRRTGRKLLVLFLYNLWKFKMQGTRFISSYSFSPAIYAHLFFSWNSASYPTGKRCKIYEVIRFKHVLQCLWSLCYECAISQTHVGDCKMFMLRVNKLFIFSTSGWVKYVLGFPSFFVLVMSVCSSDCLCMGL